MAPHRIVHRPSSREIDRAEEHAADEGVGLRLLARAVLELEAEVERLAPGYQRGPACARLRQVAGGIRDRFDGLRREG